MSENELKKGKNKWGSRSDYHSIVRQFVFLKSGRGAALSAHQELAYCPSCRVIVIASLDLQSPTYWKKPQKRLREEVTVDDDAEYLRGRFAWVAKDRPSCGRLFACFRMLRNPSAGGCRG